MYTYRSVSGRKYSVLTVTHEPQGYREQVRLFIDVETGIVVSDVEKYERSQKHGDDAA